MKNMSKISLDELSENQLFSSYVAKMQQPDADRFNNLGNFSSYAQTG